MPTALIVEDEPEANKLLSMLVQLHGYATESAFTGSEALEKVRNHVPDVVFLDLMLPDLDGYEVCRALEVIGYDQSGSGRHRDGAHRRRKSHRELPRRR